MPGLFGDLPPPSSTESKLKILESDEEDVEGQMTKRRRTEDFSGELLSSAGHCGLAHIVQLTRNPSTAAEHKSPASDGALVDNEVNEAGEPEEQAPESTADADAAAATSVPVLAGDQVAAALAKIGSHIGQAKKFLKAAELLRELLSQVHNATTEPCCL